MCDDIRLCYLADSCVSTKTRSWVQSRRMRRRKTRRGLEDGYEILSTRSIRHVGDGSSSFEARIPCHFYTVPLLYHARLLQRHSARQSASSSRQRPNPVAAKNIQSTERRCGLACRLAQSAQFPRASMPKSKTEIKTRLHFQGLSPFPLRMEANFCQDDRPRTAPLQQALACLVWRMGVNVNTRKRTWVCDGTAVDYLQGERAVLGRLLHIPHPVRLASFVRETQSCRHDKATKTERKRGIYISRQSIGGGRGRPARDAEAKTRERTDKAVSCVPRRCFIRTLQTHGLPSFVPQRR